MWPHRWQPTRLLCLWDSLGKNTGVGCHCLLQCMKVKSESEVSQSCWLLATLWTAAYQAPPSMGFSRQESRSRVPLPSPEYVSTAMYILQNQNCFFRYWLSLIHHEARDNAVLSSTEHDSPGPNAELVHSRWLEECKTELMACCLNPHLLVMDASGGLQWTSCPGLVMRPLYRLWVQPKDFNLILSKWIVLPLVLQVNK